MGAIAGGGEFQIGVYVGINLQDILYGIELVLYFMTMRGLLSHEGRRKKSHVFYAVFSSVMLLNVTIWISMQSSFGQQMWLFNANFPGGPNGYWAAHISDWNMELATAAMVVLQLMTDALMVFRCWMVWSSYRVIIVPSIMWIGTFALGAAVVWVNSTKGGIELQIIASQVCISYFSVATALTVILTSTICYRMLWFGRQLKAHLGHDYASPYFAIVALVVESVFPCMLSGIAFVIVYIVGAQFVNAFAYTHILMMCISPQILILRVAKGTALTRETCKQSHSTIKFSRGTTKGTASESEITGVHSILEWRSTQEDDVVSV